MTALPTGIYKRDRSYYVRYRHEGKWKHKSAGPSLSAALELQDQVRVFVADETKARYDASGDALYLSPIFKWFRGDFENKGGIIAFVSEYMTDDVRRLLSKKTRLLWLDYDWSLNEQTP